MATLYVAPSQAAKILSISVGRVTELCHRGKLEGAYQTLKGLWYIPISALEKRGNLELEILPADAIIKDTQRNIFAVKVHRKHET
jgi:hypothetical protein